MSLYALPLSVIDLTQLQLGIEFFTDTSEATTEAGLINQSQPTATVSSYAQQLLANNISLSQVAMAVDSLMFGATDTIAELAKLSTQFLPGQVANAIANGLNPTVYAAEALGLGLAGGNGTSNAFATEFGSLSVSQFASEVASITGVNSTAIQGFVQSWIGFYTANPSATLGLSVTLASYGAAFGDTVGAALLNPTANGTLALLTSGVQNALIDEAESLIKVIGKPGGLYKVGIPLISEPPHLPLQGEAFSISPSESTIDWEAQVGTGNYAQFDAPRTSSNLTIDNAPSTFTLNTQHYDVQAAIINAAGGHGNLFTLVLGDSTAPEAFGGLTINNYQTTEIVVAHSGSELGVSGIESDFISEGIGALGGDLVISGSGSLRLGKVGPGPGTEGSLSVGAETITDYGVDLAIGAAAARIIDASHAPSLIMTAPAGTFENAAGVTVLGGSEQGNVLQGSLGSSVKTVTFSNNSTGVAATDYVGTDNITAGAAGGDGIYGDGGADSITLPPSHSSPDLVVFGQDDTGVFGDVLAITDGFDRAYLGSWGVGTTPTEIRNLFTGNTGGTSTDMTAITGFHAGPGGDLLEFKAAAWNGASAVLTIEGLLASAKGDLVGLDGFSVVPLGTAHFSALWTDNGSNTLLKTTDNVLVYAPSDASLQNAQQLAAQLHTSDSIVLPGLGHLAPGEDKHIMVAYDASSSVNGTIQHAVNIADVDLVNMSADNQSSTANLNVYASDMVHLTGVSLTSFTPDNIHFI